MCREGRKVFKKRKEKEEEGEEEKRGKNHAIPQASYNLSVRGKHFFPFMRGKMTLIQRQIKGRKGAVHSLRRAGACLVTHAREWDEVAPRKGSRFPLCLAW